MADVDVLLDAPGKLGGGMTYSNFDGAGLALSLQGAIANKNLELQPFDRSGVDSGTVLIKGNLFELGRMTWKRNTSRMGAPCAA